MNDKQTESKICTYLSERNKSIVLINSIAIQATTIKLITLE